ncbi:tRNA/rRNA methyltransferase [Breoghania corrubedonensis]|uniref:tRNA (cytidine/uridine-2'-O-)-methyltransferase TrmJ n=1 Tax=Breoghania corrubedonensis TaxID=665038 RepID=A0A2T5VDC3_9HYPH|nr:RNA methyltransferase [Breoghania corrubedonensis]PTW61742.1 tRNA/rRNA methyltransferase [Breoghania corrubedonensis]
MSDTPENPIENGDAPAPSSPILPPAVILCEPQLGENIGTAARAMANFGLRDLRIVNPRDGWPNARANAAASRADHVIEAVKVFDRVEDAVADLHFVFATTARAREIPKTVRGPDEAAVTLVSHGGRGLATGVLFGRERWGLNNEEIALSDEIVTLPVDPTYASLNIAQAVLVIAYEWRKLATGGVLPFRETEVAPATRDELIRLFDHLEGALDTANYFRTEDKKPVMVRALRNILHKAQLTGQDVKTLRGVVAALEGRKPRAARLKGPPLTPKGSVLGGVKPEGEEPAPVTLDEE